MFALCVPVRSDAVFRRQALRGIDRVRAAYPETAVLVRGGGSYHDSANALLDEAAEIEGLEGAVLMHEDLELADATIVETLRARFRDERIAIVGVLGAIGGRGIAWWEGAPRGGRVELPPPFAMSDGGGGFHYVDAVDGSLLALSPWAVRALRFDPGAAADFHGYDVSLCLAARARGRAVAVDDIHVRHHQLDGFRDDRLAGWVNADVALQRRWSVGPSRPGEAWMKGGLPAGA